MAKEEVSVNGGVLTVEQFENGTLDIRYNGPLPRDMALALVREAQAENAFLTSLVSSLA